MTYIESTAQFYALAAQAPQANLCCLSTPPLAYPGLNFPSQMLEMNYGWGTTVRPTELVGSPTVLYIGVGGGMEALQFAYFCRRPGAVIAIEPVPEMRSVALANLTLAKQKNDWFELDFVQILPGDAFNLPVPDRSVDVVAQNCLFNIFAPSDLERALREVYRVLQPQGKLLMSDPPIPEHLQQDDRLRAMCLSGALTYEQYMEHLIRAGFGQIEVRARRPYRLLDAQSFALEEPILLDSIDTVSFKVPVPSDGACIFTGKTAIYSGKEEAFDDREGHILTRGIPLSVCDKTAAKFQSQFPEIMITNSTWHYNGGGCC